MGWKVGRVGSCKNQVLKTWLVFTFYYLSTINMLACTTQKSTKSLQLSSTIYSVSVLMTLIHFYNLGQNIAVIMGESRQLCSFESEHESGTVSNQSIQIIHYCTPSPLSRIAHLE
ncbi:hypothetical protein O5D80_008179 [Batrachochytrium dendrobatidis]|nr:hypothetical protein O5D80_008179 [Batrachochytrium dendrobatidis]